MTTQIKVWFFLAVGLFGTAANGEALTFSVPISTAGVVFVPGGRIELPSIKIAALHPVTFRTVPAEPAFLRTGENVSLRVSVVFDDDHEEDVTMNPHTSFVSNNPGAFVVSSSGVITAIGPGSGEILVEHRGKIWPVKTSVLTGSDIGSLKPLFNHQIRDEYDPAPEPESAISLAPGGTATLDVIARLLDGREVILTGNNSVNLFSDDVSIASMSALGTAVHATGFGTTHIRVEVAGISTFAVVHVAPPDASPPVTDLRFDPVPFISDVGDVFVSALGAVNIPAFDLVVGSAITSGVNFTGYTIDPELVAVESFQSYFASEGGTAFSLDEGVQTLRYASIDKAGNIEVIRSTTIFVDGTPPLTQLSVQGAGISLTSPTTVLSDSSFSLTAQDPVSRGVVSGVDRILFLIDIPPSTCPGGNPSDFPDTGFSEGTCQNPVFTMPFFLSLGQHTVFFTSQDRVGNAELYQSVAVTVTSPFPGGATNFPGPSVVLSRSSAAIELAWDPNGNPPGTVYRVIYGTAASADACNSQPGSFSFGVEVSTDRAVIGGLDPDTAYQFAVCNPELLSGQTRACNDAVVALTDSPGQGPVPNPSFTVCSSGSPGSTGPSGLDIAIDGAGKIWEVIQDGEHFNLSRFSSAGMLETSTELPDATEEAGWTIRFDASGNVYAIGTSSSPLPGVDDLAIYRVSSEGILLSSAVFRGTVDASAVSMDAAGDLWISGQLIDPVTDGFRMALWHYSVDESSLSLRATYSRGGGFDAGMGIRQVGEDIWVLGYSKNPAPQPGERAIDLALWNFNSSGTMALGPFFISDYLNDLEGDFHAKLEATAGALFAAASISGDHGDLDTSFLKFDLDGNLLLERSWNSLSNSTETIAGMAVDASGNIVVGGGTGDPFKHMKLALWRYDNRGNFLGAKTVPGIDAAEGIAIRGSDSWLALAGTGSPFRLAGETDLVGTDILYSSHAAVDHAPPVTTAQTGTPRFAALDGKVYVASATPITFAAADPLVDGEASGVARIEVSVDSAAFSVIATTLTLAEGRHVIFYRAVDNAGNTEAARSLELYTDAAAPLTEISISSPSFRNGLELIVSTRTVLELAAGDPLSNGVAAGVKETRLAVGEAPFAVHAGSFSLVQPDGQKTLRFFSRDNVENAEVERSTVVFLDGTAPRTSLGLMGGRQAPGPENGMFFASSATRFEFVAEDPELGGAVSGVAFTRFHVNGAAFEAYSASISLAEGSHRLAYQSQDNVENLEVLRSTTVLIDDAAPVTNMSIGPPTFVSPEGAVFASPGSTIAFSAQDPVSSGVASGVAATEYRLDAATGMFNEFHAGILLTEGAHSIEFRSRDLVANTELTLSTSILVDGTPPLTEFAVLGATVTRDGAIYLARGSSISLASSDPVSGGVASGLKAVSLYLNTLPDFCPGGLSQEPNASFPAGTCENPVYPGPLTLPAGGQELLFFARDRIGNQEVSRRRFLRIDALAPRTSLALGSPNVPQGFFSPAYVSSRTFMGITATDDLASPFDASGVGVKITSASLDGGIFFKFVSSFSFITQGQHTIRFLSEDSLGNRETVNISTVVVDLTPPSAAFTFPPPDALLNAQSPPVTAVLSDPAIGVFPGSGVNPTSVRVLLDGQDFSASAAITANSVSLAVASLSDGTHTVKISMADLIGNRSGEFSLSFRLDKTPPAVGISTPAADSFTSSRRPPLRAVYSDFGAGLDLAALRLELDGSTVAAAVSAAGGSAGEPGPWLNATPLPSAQSQTPIVAWNGYFYSIAGSFNNLVKYAKVNADGSLGPWVFTHPTPLSVHSPEAVVVNGRLYVMGGVYGSSAFNNVYFTQTNPDGSIAPWTATASMPFPGGTSYFGAVAIGEFIYVMGGENASCGVHRKVFFARSCAAGVCHPVTGSAASPWVETTSLPVNLDKFDATALGDCIHIYVTGGNIPGCANVPVNTVYHVDADPVTGQLGPWILLPSSLPAPRLGHTTLAANGHLYVLGGYNSSLQPQKTVFYAKILPGHVLGPWVNDPKYYLTAERADTDGVVWNDRLYLMGGQGPAGTGAQSTVFASQVSAGLATSATAAFTPNADLVEGAHAVSGSVLDLAGNQGTGYSGFSIDLTAPVSRLDVLGSSRPFAGALYVKDDARLMIAAQDPVSNGVASGVKETRLSMAGGTYNVSAGTFSLAEGTHDLSFFSVDNAGNRESTRTARVIMDSTPPAPAADLRAVEPSTDSLSARWTAPGDNASSGTILSGELRVQYSTDPGVAFASGSAQIVQEITNQTPGASKILRFAGLAPGTTYFFALWSRDTAGNYSAISNIASAQTLSLAKSVDNVASLLSPRADAVLSTVAVAQAAGQFAVASAQGLRLLTTGFYEITPSPVVYSTPAVLSFILDPAGADISQLAIYRFNGVAWDSSPVTGQMTASLAGGLIELKGFLLTASLYGVFDLLDIRPPRSELLAGSPSASGEGRVFITSRTVITLSSLDDFHAVGDGRGLGVSGQELGVNGLSRFAFVNPAPARGQVFASTFTLSDPDGLLAITFLARDTVGNQETPRPAALAMDNTAPRTSFAVSTPSFGSYISSETVLTLSATDPLVNLAASGVAFTQYRINGSSFTSGPLAFSLAGLDGSYFVEFQSQDKVGNRELLGSTTVLLDITPPSAAFTFPAPGAFLGASGSVVASLSDPVLGAIAGSGVDPATVKVFVDGQDFSAQAALSATAASLSAAHVTEGSHIITISLADRIGNRSGIFSLPFKVDKTPPAVTVSSPANNSFTANRRPLLAASYSDFGSGLDGGSPGLKLDGVSVPAQITTSLAQLSAWSAATSLPGMRYLPGAAALNGYAYIVGGESASGPLASTLFARINGDGTLGSWQSTSQLPETMTAHRVVAAAGTLYAIGGYEGTSGINSNVYYARPNPDGTLSPWTAAASLPFNSDLGVAGAAHFGAAVVNGFVYVMAGEAFNGTVTKKVHYAKVCSEGLCHPTTGSSSAAWAEAAPLPFFMFRTAAAVADDCIHLFALGGSQSVTGAVHTEPNAVSGAVASWTPDPQLPSNTMLHAAMIAGGRAYVFGGWNPSVSAPAPTFNSTRFAPVNTVFSAPINANHGLGTWVNDPSKYLPEPRQGAGGIEWNNRLYLIGGHTGAQGNTLQGADTARSAELPPLNSATASFVPAADIAEGLHTAAGSALDLAGNQGTGSSGFSIDLTAPVSRLDVLGSSRPFAGALYVKNDARLMIAAQDPVSNGVASGIKESRLKTDVGVFIVQIGTFSLSEGTHDLGFFSVDNVGNVESSKTARVIMDSIPPASAGDLAAVEPSTSSLSIAWTAPGDNGASGTILSGELRIQYSSDSGAAFSTGSAQIAQEIISSAPGAVKRLTVTGLATGTTYFFALWSRDTAGNYSGISNIASAQTLSLAKSVDNVASLLSPRADAVLSTVAVASAAGQFAAASSQGLRLLTTGFYEITPSPVVYSTPAVLSFILDPAGADLAQVAIYRFNGVAWDSAPVTGQTITLLTGGLIELKGVLLTASLYGVFEIYDNRPPRSELLAGLPKAQEEDRVFITSRTVMTLSSIDDFTAAGDGIGFGVSGQELGVNGLSRFSFANPAPARGQVFASTFTLPDPDGLLAIKFSAGDTVGNRETLRPAALAMDNTAPQTSFSVSTPSFGSYVSSETVLTLSATDPLVNLAASGVAFTQYRLNGSPYTSGPLTFSLAGMDGSYFVEFQSRDKVDNLEVLRSTTVLLDATAPVTNLLVNGRASLEASLVLVSTDVLSFAAADAGSGVRETRYILGVAPEAVFTSTFTAPAGTHVLSFHSRDNVGNRESTVSAGLTVLATDSAAPALSLRPLDRSTVTTARPLLEAFYSDLGRGINRSAVRLVLDGVDVTASASVTDSTASFQTAADLAQGNHVLAAVVADLAGNISTATASFFIDSAAPLTSLVIGAPKFGGEPVFIATYSALSFTVSEPAETYYAVDGGTFNVFTAAFNLAAEGARLLRYFSVDRAGNSEAVRSSTVTVDASAPVTVLLVNGVAVSSSGLIVISTDALSFAAADAASGVRETVYALNGGAPAIFSVPFNLAAGSRTLTYHSRDNVENLEAARSVSLLVRDPDPAAPSLSLSPVFGSTVTVARPAITASYADAATGVDPASVRLFVDGLDVTALSSVGASSATFNPAGDLAQGTHTAAALVHDYAGNVAQAGTAFFLDSLAPVTTLLINGGAVSGGPLAAATTDVFSLSAADSGVGVLETLLAIDGAQEQAFSTPFTLSTGTHVLAFRSRDRAGHLETLKSLTVVIFNPNVFPTARAGPDRKALVNEAVSFDGSASTDSDGIIAIYRWNFGDGSDEVLGSSVTHVYTATGSFTVSLTVTDNGGATAADLAAVLVQTPAQAIADLEAQIAGIGLPGGTANEFVGKLEAAVKSLAKGNYNAALNQLDSFVNSVNAQRGNKLTAAEADFLVAEAGRIRDAIESTLTVTEIKTPAATASAGFGLVDLYAFPNPAKNINSVTLRAQVGLADEVDITVYNILGYAVYNGKADQARIVDDGNGKGPQWTYDHVWNLGRVGSGVYIFRIKATKAGEKPIIKTGKVGVIK